MTYNESFVSRVNVFIILTNIQKFLGDSYIYFNTFRKYIYKAVYIYEKIVYKSYNYLTFLIFKETKCRTRVTESCVLRIN